MIHPNIDANRLAAFLAGSLDARERAQMVEELASSEEGAALLADAVAVLRELEAEGLAPAPALPPEDDAEEEDEDERELDPPRAAAPEAAGGEAKVIRLPLAPAEAPRHAEPAPPPAAASGGGDDRVTPIGTRRRAPAARWIAWAAVAAGVALVPLLWARFGRPAADDPLRAVAMVEGAPLPDGWNSQPWSTTRGGEVESADSAASARVGALLVDLEVALSAGNTADAALQAARVAEVLDGMTATGPLSSHYRGVAEMLDRQESAAVEEPLEEGWGLVTEFLVEERVRLGAWVEAGRLAAARRDAEFFRDRGARAVLERAAGDSALSERARGAAGRASSAAAGETPDWAALETSLGELLEEIGS